jgi:2-amino-4-hydroxy-6-hydroxymethyldihydropteridine diphosphokinase
MNAKIKDIWIPDESKDMNRAYILTGGNLDNRSASLATARELINRHCGSIIQASSVYETAAWGKTDQPAFLNQALEICTSLNARQLIRRLLKVEKMMGRIRGEKYGPRLIDLDLLLFNNEIHNYHFLQLPHPQMQNRRFVLMPMAEIAPEIIHPVLLKSITDLLKECPDQLEVTKIPD